MVDIYIFENEAVVPAKVERLFGTHGPHTLEGKRLDFLTKVQILADSSATTTEHTGEGTSKAKTDSVVGRAVVQNELTVELFFNDDTSQYVFLKGIDSFHWLLSYVNQTPLTDDELKVEEEKGKEQVVTNKRKLNKKDKAKEKAKERIFIYKCIVWVFFIAIVISSPISSLFLVPFGLCISFVKSFTTRGVVSISIIIFVLLSLVNEKNTDVNEAIKSNKTVSLAKTKDPKDPKDQAKKIEANKAKTKKILATLKTVPVSEYRNNLDLYRELVTYNPDIQKYQQKVEFYWGKIKAEKDKLREEVDTYKRVRATPEKFLKIIKTTWFKDSFGTVATVNVKIKNTAPLDLKDVKIRCEFYANSGTKINSFDHTIYDVVESNSTRTFKKINLGIINAQASKGGCQVWFAKVMED